MEYLKIGFIKKPHGVKGFIKILPLTENINRFNKLNKIYIKINDNYREEEVEESILANDSVLLKLKNINSSNEAEKIKSLYIFISRDDGLPLENGEYYTQDLIGCDFYFDNKNIGKVINVENFGTCDLFIVKFNKEEVFYPFLNEYINFIDIKNKKIIINQFEGFFT